mgnify:CR=1 FL=1
MTSLVDNNPPAFSPEQPSETEESTPQTKVETNEDRLYIAVSRLASLPRNESVLLELDSTLSVPLCPGVLRESGAVTTLVQSFTIAHTSDEDAKTVETLFNSFIKVLQKVLKTPDGSDLLVACGAVEKFSALMSHLLTLDMVTRVLQLITDVANFVAPKQ